MFNSSDYNDLIVRYYDNGLIKDDSDELKFSNLTSSFNIAEFSFVDSIELLSEL